MTHMKIRTTRVVRPVEKHSGITYTNTRDRGKMHVWLVTTLCALENRTRNLWLVSRRAKSLHH